MSIIEQRNACKTFNKKEESKFLDYLAVGFSFEEAVNMIMEDRKDE